MYVSLSLMCVHYYVVSPKVENLNVLSDSNKLLREEKRKQDERVEMLERRCEELEGEIGPLKESIRQLTAQKDVLVAEKTALRCV